jgi:GH25 family lysozyme M1 (1,4-beta-N-acetylmuramidase)
MKKIILGLAFIAAMLFTGVGKVNATTPSLNFIDISNYTGVPTKADFQAMKAKGAKGVVIYLSNGYADGKTYTVSTKAKDQIANAKAAGMKIAVYHEGVYSNQNDAKAEAKFFAKTATKYGLPKTTVMVDDIENNYIINTKGKSTQNISVLNITKNVMAFQNTLHSKGFHYVVNYMNKNFEQNYVDYTWFGKDNLWLADYNNKKPALSGISAWQWSESGKYSGFGSTLDLNKDYLGRFTNKMKPMKTSGYYTKTSGKAILTKKTPTYTNFKLKNGKKNTAAGTTVTIRTVVPTNAGTPTLLLTNGRYITAKVKNVMPTSIKKYYTSYAPINKVKKGQKIQLKKAQYVFKKNNLVKKNRKGKKLKKNTIVKIKKVTYKKDGFPVLSTNKGYISAKKTDVKLVK